MERDEYYGKETQIKYSILSDRIEEECNCQKCDKFMCFTILEWLVPMELRDGTLCTISEGKHFGFRCNDCFSKWNCYNVREEYGEDLSDDEIDTTTIVQDIICEYCDTHCAFFLERAQSNQEQELNQKMYEDRQRRRMSHMSSLELEYENRPYLTNKIVCLNCRNHLN